MTTQITTSRTYSALLTVSTEISTFVGLMASSALLACEPPIHTDTALDTESPPVWLRIMGFIPVAVNAAFDTYLTLGGP